MAARRPAKLAITKKERYVKYCPTCAATKGKQDQAMQLLKMVRCTKPSGMFWVCPVCNSEIPTHG